MRSIQESDTDHIIAWRNADHVRPHFLDRSTLTEEMHTKWLDQMVNTGKCVQLIIQALSAREDVGTIYLRDIDYRNRKAELGIFIGVGRYLGGV